MKLPNIKKHRIFISHSWNYDEYERIINFLDNTTDFAYINYSVPYQKAIDTRSKAKLKEALHARIKNSQIVLIPVGMEINYREFILFELEIAQAMHKPIIGILPRGQKKIPQVITSVAWEIVGWNRNSIVKSIQSNSL